MVALMAQRDELFRQFGPMLLEAFAVMILEEVNRIRQHVGMPQITKQQVLNEINNHLSALEQYDWMKEEPP